MIFIRIQTFQRAASLSATLNTNATLHRVTLSPRDLCCGSWKIDVLYGAFVSVQCTSLLAGLCVSRTLQCTVAGGTALFTWGSVAFQTASSTQTALITSVSLTDNWGAVTPYTAEFTFSGSLTCQVTTSTSANETTDLVKQCRTLALARSPRRVWKVSGECKSSITRPFGECNFRHQKII